MCGAINVIDDDMKLALSPKYYLEAVRKRGRWFWTESSPNHNPWPTE
jgi:hypothetical protein